VKGIKPTGKEPCTLHKQNKYQQNFNGEVYNYNQS